MGQETFRFHFGEIPSSKGEKDLMRKSLIFLFSILLHTALFVFLLSIQLFFPVEMPERVIYEVEIREPESLYFPEGEIRFSEPHEYFRESLRENLRTPDTLKEEILSRDPAEKAIDSPDSYEPAGEEVSESLPAGGSQNRREAALFSNTLSQFRLDLPEEQDPKLSFNLERDSERAERSPESSLNRELKIPDAQYSRGIGLSSPRYSRYARKTGAGRISPRRGSSYSIGDIDISPWADETIRKIQENWSIPEESSARIKGNVGIYLKIRREGELISSEIVESSGFSSLDQAALKAIDASFPLPELPASFPADSLEIYLVFDYDV